MGEAVAQKKKLSLVSVVFMMYIFISGGAFGIEDMIGGAGPGISFVVLLVLPLVWAYPYGLICTELGARYTEESGFYGWIKRALGRFAAYIAGWSMTLANFVDTAVYLVIAVGYLDAALGLNLSPMATWLIGLVFVAIFCLLNIKGVDLLAFSSTVTAIMILAPFTLLILFSIPQMHFNPLVPVFASAGSGLKGALGDINTALLVGLWMFMGYESIHSFADEVEGAGPLISKAFMWAVPLAAIMYLLPTFFALSVTGSWQDWSTEGPLSFVEVGAAVGGNFLMILFLIAGFVGNLGTFSSYLGFGARVTSDMAEDGLFFKGFDKVGKNGTPYVAIIAAAVITGILSYGSFSDLIVIDVILLLIPVILIFISGVVLRLTDTSEVPQGAFRLPIGNGAFMALAMLPTAIAVYAIVTTEIESLVAGGICILLGVVMYYVFPKINKRAVAE